MATDELQNPIDRVVYELCNSEDCKKAVAYYENLGVNIRCAVLERGSTDFDRAFRDESGAYKVDAYIHKYMQMHYQRNLAVFKQCNFLNTAKPLLFIDFGCGPVISGLALLRRLNLAAGQDRIIYWGVDVSQWMLDKCKRINSEFQLYRNAIFSRALSDVAVNKKINASFLVVINFGYVLSGHTLKSNSIDKVLDDVVMVCESALSQVNNMYVIYQNPVVPDSSGAQRMHGNWNRLCTRIRQNLPIRQHYTGECPYNFSNSSKKTKFAQLQIGITRV